jgi:hypothetical protein
MPGAKHWCFTINNYDEDTAESDLRDLYGGGSVQYLVFGRETADTGTRHLQGYVVFESRRTLRQVRQAIRGAHLEKSKGTPLQASDYCKKEQDFEEYGTLPGGQGTRTDVQSTIEACKEAKTLREIIEEHGATYVKFARGFDKIRCLYTAGRTWQTEVYVYWGETGAGKTRKAWEEAPTAYAYAGQGWFDGYDGEEAVIFDDFGGSEFKITYLLKLFDRYPMRVPVKGGYVQWVPRRIFVTSNLDPDTWYPNAHAEHVAALKRRFKKVIHFSIPF